MSKTHQEWVHALYQKLPNTDHAGRYSLDLTGNEVFYIKNLVHTDYMLGFNASAEQR